jgi:glycosyltransferase involved in cell wall biosynthesis
VRNKLFGGWILPDDILFVNVNRNERRKMPQHSLQILKGLVEAGVKAKLYLHMPKIAQGEQTDLEQVAKQIGLDQKHWSHGDKFFVNYNGLASEEGMNDIYNAGDFCLSTSAGEGWGLAAGSESIAAGCQVIAADNTSLGEIGRMIQKYSEPGRFTLLPLAPEAVTNMLDNSRVRYPIDLEASVKIISDVCKSGLLLRYTIPDALKEFLSWKRIAGEFVKLMIK